MVLIQYTSTFFSALLAFQALLLPTIGFSCHSSTLGLSSLTRSKGTDRTTVTLHLFWFGNKDEDSEKTEGRLSEKQQQKRKGSFGKGMRNVLQVMDGLENSKMAQSMGKITEGILHDLASSKVEGSSAYGKVRVYYDGQQRPIDVSIDETYAEKVSTDDLSAALLAAMQDAHRKSEQMVAEQMKALYSELGILS